jgi:N-acetylgalactosamine-6-sulfatase
MHTKLLTGTMLFLVVSFLGALGKIYSLPTSWASVGAARPCQPAYHAPNKGWHGGTAPTSCKFYVMHPSSFQPYAFVHDPQASPRKPNVLFILADDWGWGDLGCYGHERLRTPNLDRLAKQGIQFTQFYVANPVCSPSRAAFLTGHFPARHAIHGHLATPEQNAARGMPNSLDPKVTTLAKLLKGAGYVTGHFGKWHLSSGPQAFHPSEYGFDVVRAAVGGSAAWVWHDPERNRAQSTEMIVDETIKFIETHRDKPFYAQAWILDTHARLQPTEEQMKAYPNLIGATRIYYSAATDADKHIGRLLRKLDELGLTENTIVIFSSDNGPEEILIGNASEHGVGSPGPFRGRKRSLYEGGVRTPFIVRYPARTPAGKVDSTTVIGAVDFLPTICSLAGVKLPDHLDLDGEDMSDALLGKPKERTKPLFWEWRFRIFGHVINRSPMLAIREGRWKLLMNPDRSRVELYDIPNDLSELNNLADKHSDVVKRLSEKLLKWQATLPKGPVEKEAGQNTYPMPRGG